VAVIKKVLAAAEQKKVLEAQLSILEGRITNFQEMIQTFAVKDSLTVATYDTQLKAYKEEKAIYQDQLKGYERLLRRQKRKTFLTGAAGLLTTGAALYLFMQK
jgi:hypothetical protein